MSWLLRSSRSTWVVSARHSRLFLKVSLHKHFSAFEKLVAASGSGTTGSICIT